ncbi:MAG: glycosyltransferase [Acidobacteriota bacterium]
MKIFFPLEVYYPSQGGGTANIVYWIAKNLVKHGYEPTVVATDKGIQPGVPLNRWIRNEAGSVIYVKTRRLNFPLRQLMVSLSSFYRSDIIQMSSFFFPTAFLTAFAARLLKKKMVWSPQGELDGAAFRHSMARKRPVLWSIKNFVGKYPTFHSTCEEESEYIRNVFGRDAKIVQIPNYVAVPNPVERKAEDYLLYLGRIHPKKAIDNLIDAVAQSQEFMTSNFVLKVAGAGKKEFEDELRQKVDDLNLSSKVKFVGQFEGEEKEHIYANAYWTIMPSHTENFGIVVPESLAQSTPVIASKGTPWACLEDEKVGFWIENDPQTLANKIDEILTMPASEYEQYRQRCRGFVEREFDIDQNIDKWIDLYEGL